MLLDADQDPPAVCQRQEARSQSPKMLTFVTFYNPEPLNL